MSEDHLEHIRTQFNRQGEAYAKLEYVSHDRALAGLVRMAQASSTDRMLDVACGPGFVTLAFAEVCAEAVGVDATENFVRMARGEAERRGLDSAKFVVGNVESTEFADNAFDIAVCRAAFHHFPDPAKVLAEMIRVTKPDGRLLIADMVADEDPQKAAYQHDLEVRCDPTHVRALTRRAFEALFAEAGLEVMAQREGQSEYDVNAWIAHGGPSDSDAKALREMLQHCLENDLAGLPVWEDNGVLMMAHPGMAYSLRKK